MLGALTEDPASTIMTASAFTLPAQPRSVCGGGGGAAGGGDGMGGGDGVGGGAGGRCGWGVAGGAGGAGGQRGDIEWRSSTSSAESALPGPRSARSSILKTRASPGPMSSPAPASPYASSDGT